MGASTRTCAVLLALTCLAAVGGCSGEDASGGGSGGGDGRGEARSQGVSDDFPSKDVIISARCEPATKTADAWYGGRVFVDGWKPGSWEHVAHTEFPLPERAISGQNTNDTTLTGLCMPAETGAVSSMRSLFDRDFTKHAVVTEDPQTGKTHVGYVDRQGKFTDLTGPGEFGDDSEERAAAMSPDGREVWLTSEKDSGWILASRSVAGGRDLVERAKLESYGKISFVGSPPKPVVSDHDVALSPDGEHLAFEGRVVKTAGKEVFDGTGEEDEDLLGDARCRSVAWVGEDEVLCDGGTNYTTAELSAGKPSKPVLSADSKNLFTMVPSPDGGKITFITEDGDRYDHWISGTEPGSEPQRIAPGSDFAESAGTPVILEWR